MTGKPEPFQTSELPLAAAIIASGFPLLEVGGKSGFSLVFSFAYNDKIPKIEQAYYEGTLATQVLPFINAERKLRGIIKRWRAEHDDPHR